MESKKVFNKLVRDKIPEIIKNNGDIPEIEILDDLAYSKMLEKKLLEECEELITANDEASKIEELADILEVLHAIANTLDITMNEIEEARLSKQKKRGAFEKRLLLKSTVSKSKK